MTELEVVRPGALEGRRTTEGEQRAGFLLLAFLAGYSGRTREAYATDLRQWGTWCDGQDVGVLAVTRAHVQVFARSLEDAGRAPATIGRKLSAVGGFYAYCVVEGVLPKSPVAPVRRPAIPVGPATNTVTVTRGTQPSNSEVGGYAR